MIGKNRQNIDIVQTSLNLFSVKDKLVELSCTG